MMMRALITTAFFGILFVPGAPAAQEPPPAGELPAVQLPAGLDRVLRDYEAAWAAGDAEGLAALFTADGVVRGDGGWVRGPGAIAGEYANAGGPLRLEAVSFGSGGEAGFVVGRFGYDQGGVVLPGGLFILALRRAEGGRWEIEADLDRGLERGTGSIEGAVPDELRQALFGPMDRGGPGSRPEILVGEAPQDVLDALAPPPEYRLLGSMVGERTTTLGFAAPGDSASTRSTWIDHLLDLGWDRYEPLIEARGFQENRPEFLQFCRDDVSAGLRVSPSEAGGSVVRVTWMSDLQLSPCRAAARRAARTSRESPMPTLLAPEGARARGGGSGGGGGDWSSHSRIETDLSVEDLLTHYGAQMEDAGWEMIDGASLESTAVATFALTDEDGVPWHGLLTASRASPDGPALLTLQVARADGLAYDVP